jgi:FLVCR family MFS transporter 7
MHRALIFHGAFILATASTIFLLRGKQARKELDELKQQQALGGASSNVGE